MKWKVLLFAFLLIATAVAISITATFVLSGCLNSGIMDAFDFNNLLLDGGFTPTGGGDPLPGGGIPT